jgi:hypothetical protein
MDNIYFIHDAGTGKLVIKRIKSRGDDEEAVMRVAEREGMHWGDCSWGGVDSIGITL